MDLFDQKLEVFAMPKSGVRGFFHALNELNNILLAHALLLGRRFVTF